MPLDIMTITDQQIRDLRKEAAARQDWDMTDCCDDALALCGIERDQARLQCVRVINRSAAQPA